MGRYADCERRDYHRTDVQRDRQLPTGVAACLLRHSGVAAHRRDGRTDGRDTAGWIRRRTLHASWAVEVLVQPPRLDVLVAEDPGLAESIADRRAILRLARVGYDNVIGYLEGGIDTWVASGQEVDTITSITPDELADKMAEEKVVVIDVRRPSEFSAEHIDGAKSLPLDYISELMAEFPKDQTMYIHCAGGYRSMIASSILKSRGYDNLIDIAGGFAAISKSGRFTLTDYVCPSTLKKS